MRDEFLERVEFEDVADARAKASWYRREDNAVRPHSSLDYATPKEFMQPATEGGVIGERNELQLLALKSLKAVSLMRWTKKWGAGQPFGSRLGTLTRPSGTLYRREKGLASKSRVYCTSGCGW